MEKNDRDTGQWVDDRLAQLNGEQAWHPDVSQALARFHERQAIRRRWPWMMAAVAAGCACVVAFPAPRAVAQRCVDACSVLFQKKIDLPAMAAAKGNKDRQSAPDFTVKDGSGGALRLSDYKGKVVLLNFWATNCAPCRAEIPWFIEFERAYKDRGFEVLGISMDEDGWKAIRPFVEEKKVNYRVGLGNDDLAQKYGNLDALPDTFLIDRDGRVAEAYIGLVPRAQSEKEIVRLLDEKRGR